MKKRPQLRVEQLEARVTPDVSLGRPAALALPLATERPALDGAEQLAAMQTSVEVQHSQAIELAPPATYASNSENAALHSRILESLFRNTQELDKLLSRTLKQHSADGTLPDGNEADAGTLDALEAAGAGWKFFQNYARKAIRNEEHKYGRLANHDDLLNEIYVEWRDEIGAGEHALGHLLDKNSAERQALRTAVRRVLDHERYDQQRQQKVVELIDHPAPDNPAAREWRDLQIDWSEGVGDLTPREREVLELRRQGMTFEEIGAELGLAKQRVCEVLNATLERLQDVYAG